MAQPYQPTPREPGASQETALEAALLLLVDVLSRKGVIRLEDYRNSVAEMWNQMPAEDAGSSAGQLFERLISNLADAITERDRRAAKKAGG